MEPADGYPPPPPPPTRVSTSARYTYLINRLRSREITMNEATELFELQQSTLAAALARAPPSAPPAPRAAAGGAPAPPAPEPAPGAPTPSVDDAFWMGLLAAGAGAGILAAVLKRARAPEAPAAEGRREPGPDPH